MHGRNARDTQGGIEWKRFVGEDLEHSQRNPQPQGRHETARGGGSCRLALQSLHQTTVSEMRSQTRNIDEPTSAAWALLLLICWLRSLDCHPLGSSCLWGEGVLA